MTKSSYHHGDLRRALLDAGLELLQTREAHDLSLREVARAVGVSATAVYRHFPDKDALLDALAAEGLGRLGAAQFEAAQAAGGGEKGFVATGIAYVRFALANPALFRLTFSATAARNILAQPPEHVPDAMAFLRQNARLAAEQTGLDPHVIAVRAWSIAHGLALLMLERQVEADEDLIEAVISAEVLKPRPSASR
ncbi:TetR/AcrR family transcriptional regulator [Sphingomonas sp. ID1715]|uniref:TetR/AcrR family transcriptional regulator n=1 Tax=Sphingomonas sp. ID1715 TaxID=1656898 RepID=UPI001487751A|nr:TetR/AcrR family transcriptional regulator [Sphingomonas sp. ID1715]NNM77420.1 TetR/AcrR family transcriptional regulator [Sphingomonas sp. ID1715]